MSDKFQRWNLMRSGAGMDGMAVDSEMEFESKYSIANAHVATSMLSVVTTSVTCTSVI